MVRARDRTMSILLWGALAAVIGIAAYLMLYACGLRFFGYQFLNCPPVATTVEPPRTTGVEDLQRRIRDAERALRERPACRAEAPAPVTLPAVREALNPPPRAANPPPVRPTQTCTVERNEDTSTVVILDGSRSMLLPYDISPERDRELHNRLIGANSLPAGEREAVIAEYDQAVSGTSGRRIDRARDAIVNALQGAGGSVGAVVFEHCDAIDAVSGANAAIARIRATVPRGGTPIAAALQRAANQIPPGANGRYDGNIIIVTDGAESCGGNACETAKAIKRERPGIVINVIDIAGWTDIACIARETGGFVRRGGGDLDLQPLLNDAVKRRAVDQCEGAIERPR